MEVFPTHESPTNITLKAHDGKPVYGVTISASVVSTNIGKC